MRTTSILAIVTAALVSNSAVAKVKRIEFIPESIRGSWAPSAEVCEKAATSMITVSATTYASSGANCKIMWIGETSAARGPMYSAHLQCGKPEEKAPKTQSDVIFYPKDEKQIVLPVAGATEIRQERPPTEPDFMRRRRLEAEQAAPLFANAGTLE